MNLTRYGLIVLGLMTSMAACGGGQPEPTTPAGAPSAAPTPAATGSAPAATGTAPTAPAATGPAATGATKSWNDMTHEERLALMKSAVMPKMSAAFKEVDAEDFKDFSCITCHGKRIKEGKFDMPNPDLPKLDPKDGFKKHMQAKPAITKFMMTRVVPEMASTLGLQPYDPATHTGFGCANCHLFEK